MLDISHNGACDAVPGSMFAAPALRCLDASACNLSGLPEAPQGSARASLAELRLDGNANLSVLPEWVLDSADLQVSFCGQGGGVDICW